MSEQVTFNDDGTANIPVDGKSIRYAKESDLLVVKGGKEKAEREWAEDKTKFQTDLAEANRLRAEDKQQHIQATAAYELSAESHKDYDTHKTRVGELETEKGSLTEKLTASENELAEGYRQGLLAAGATEETIKDKTLDQLRSLVDAAKVFGKVTIPANYDGGKGQGGAGDLANKNPMQLATEAYASSNK